MTEWYAVVAGAVGDPIDDRIDLEDIERHADAACVTARALALETGRPHRVVRITEVAVFAAPIVKTGAAGDALKRE